MVASNVAKDVFSLQAGVARQMGSEFVARVMEAGARQLPQAPITQTMIAHWSGDPWGDAVALRFGGALHALARQEATPGLAALYRDLHGDFDKVLADALRQEDGTIAGWLRSAPQTNEVGRSAAIWAALAVSAERHGSSFELLELGSSAGLNLNLGLYGYELGGIASGDLRSPVVLKPEWRGGPPPHRRDIVIRRARGVDLAPLNVRDPVARERLSAYVWPDDHARAVRLERAMTIAIEHPPSVDQADAADWIEHRLEVEQEAGIARVVFHSIVLQYLPAPARARVQAAIQAAGHRATPERPLVWIAFEWDPARTRAALRLRSWPDGYDRELATCQAHAAWIDWTSP